MEEHLEAVASRALIVALPSKNRELKDVLALYAREPALGAAKNESQRAKH
jgi:hypothetical protein